MAPLWGHTGLMVKFNLRLPEDVYEQAKSAAAADDRSLNSWLVSLVRRAIKEGERRRVSDT